MFFNIFLASLLLLWEAAAGVQKFGLLLLEDVQR